MDNEFASFGQWSVKYNLPHSDFFSILCKWSILWRKTSRVLRALVKKRFWFIHFCSLELLSLSHESKKLVTKVVNIFAMNSVPASCMKTARGREIISLLPDKIWRTALSHFHSCSVKSRHRLIQFKWFNVSIILRLCWISPCDRCKSNNDTLLHLFWDCPLSYPFG